MVHAHAAEQHLPQFGPDALRPVELVHDGVDLPALPAPEQVEPFQLLGRGPAFVAVEAKNQRRRLPRRLVPLDHVQEQFAQELIGHPVISERDLAFLALDQIDLALMAALQPLDEFVGIADRGGEQQQSRRFRQHRQRQFPDDAALQIAEVMEFIHDHGGHVVEIESFRVQ